MNHQTILEALVSEDLSKSKSRLSILFKVAHQIPNYQYLHNRPLTYFIYYSIVLILKKVGYIIQQANIDNSLSNNLPFSDNWLYSLKLSPMFA